jgi:hypothetical protein
VAPWPRHDDDSEGRADLFRCDAVAGHQRRDDPPARVDVSRIAFVARERGPLLVGVAP